MSNKVHVIDPKPYEKAITIAILICISFVSCICAYWLYIFFKSRNHYMRIYRESLKIRQQKYVIFSYVIMLPWLVQEAIATMYLYWDGKDRSSPQGIEKWTYLDGIPIYYSFVIDEILHYLFWIALWSFMQFKLLKIWRLWCLHESDRQIIKFCFKFNLRYQEDVLMKKCKYITNNVFIFVFIIPMLIVGIEAIIRESEHSQTKEHVGILIIFICQYIIYGWPLTQIPKNDNFFVDKECKYLYIVSLVLFVDWIVFDNSYNNLDYIWVKSGTLLLYSIWILISCYIETIWVLNKLKQTYECKTAKTHQLMASTSVSCMQPIRKTNELMVVTCANNDGDEYGTNQLKDLLLKHDGMDVFMNFLLKEFACKDLFCYIEITEYITRWKPENELLIAPVDNDKRYVLLVKGYVRMMDDKLYHDVACIVLKYYKHLYIECGLSLIEKFGYLAGLLSGDEQSQYEYLMEKYLAPQAILKVNISKKLSKKMQEGDITQFVERLNELRAELWTNLDDALSRFIMTEDYVNFYDEETKSSISHSIN